ncbi:MAG: glutamate-cysteine ligase family protein [Planctomycetota bacterium]
MALSLFQGFGIELEYMIVGRDDFAVRPIADELLRAAAGRWTGDFSDGSIEWSNELAAHVIELKTNGPVPDLSGAAREFHRSLSRQQRLLEPMGARLLPSGMHPTMDPAREFVRWRHDYSEVYEAYDRIFDCRGHGWSNLQSCHLNLPFANDDEFARLHLSCRALLPLMPALAAASPYCEGRFTGWLDYRIQAYRRNQDRVPRIAGSIVPEPVASRQEYYETILEPIWRDIEPLDPERILREEWLNSRGVVAKFFRDALEIRVLDCQESPFADLAICVLIAETLRALCAERWCPLAALKALPTGELADLLLRVARDGDRAVVDHAGLLAALGLPGSAIAALDVWRRLADRVLPGGSPADPDLALPLDAILSRGPLARRMLEAAGPAPDREGLFRLCRGLALCLEPEGPRSFPGRPGRPEPRR